MKMRCANFIRYPGGKQRLLWFLMPYLPRREFIKRNFVEPFVGGGAVFFALNPKSAILTDINPMLIDLYRGLRRYPLEVWNIFKNFPTTKAAYYKIRNMEVKNLCSRAARILYLNRTCFKGMWRENGQGKFNVGYGGQDRRWVVNEDTLLAVARYLKKAKLKACDFEETIDNCCEDDFLFLDPPYCPGEKELTNAHYVYSKFTFMEHKRLASALHGATKRNVKWAMTTSSHPDIISLFKKYRITPFCKGTGKTPGVLTKKTAEVVICNYQEGELK